MNDTPENPGHTDGEEIPASAQDDQIEAAPKPARRKRTPKPALEAMSKICRERLEQFGTAGQASKIGKIRPLSEMAKLYAAGKLDPTFS